MGILVGIFLIIIFILVAILVQPLLLMKKVKEVGEIKTEVIQGKNGVELIKLVDDEANKLLVEMLNRIINELKLDFNKEWEENFSSFDENKYGSSKQEETIIYIPKDSIFTDFNPNLE